LADLLQVASLACSTFYYQCKTIQRTEPIDLEVKVRAVYDEHKGRYGYRRITAALRNSPEASVNHKCAQRLMQKMELRAPIRSKKRSRYVPEISDVHVPTVLKRYFFAKAPNEKWATDITEFNVNGQKLYLSACMDLYNGEIIAHRMAKRPIFDLVSDTLDVALARSKHIAGLTVHSDQGWH
jgi:putative transposase